jgi:hypothetical protein
VCDVLGFSGSFAVVVIVEGIWDDGIFGLLAKVDDAVHDGADGTAMHGATACMIDNFAAGTIFMRGKDQ